MNASLSDSISFGNETLDALLVRYSSSAEIPDSSDFNSQRRIQLLETEMTSLLLLIGELLYKNERLRQALLGAIT